MEKPASDSEHSQQILEHANVSDPHPVREVPLRKKQQSDKLANGTLERTIEAYNSIASEYAARWSDAESLKHLYEPFMFELPSNSSILDAGCGHGRDLRFFHEWGYDVVGVDACESMIAAALSINANTPLRVMDIRALAYPSNSFDAVWALSVLHHLEDEHLTVALKEFRRTLVDNGLAFFSFEEGDGTYFDQVGRFRSGYRAAEIESKLEHAGFKVNRIWTVRSAKPSLGCTTNTNWINVLARTRKSSDRRQTIADDNCPFCSNNRFSWNRRIGVPGTSSVVFAENGLYLAPDIAPLVDGHSLLVTEKHNMCFGAERLLNQTDLNSAFNQIRQLFLQTYGKQTIFFEHGPAVHGEAGTCIDHAHFHCLPTDLPLRHILEEKLGKGRSIQGLGALQQANEAGKSYLYLQESEQAGSIFDVDVLPSQYMRKAMASFCGTTKWDWRETMGLSETKERHLDTTLKLGRVWDRLMRGRL